MFKSDCITLSIIVLSMGVVACQTQPVEAEVKEIGALVEQLVREGAVAGAQVAVGQAEAPVELKSFGVRDVRNGQPVDRDTCFCIGSCSKMFAGAVLVSLASSETVKLDVPIDRWLKACSSPRLVSGGRASRPPTLRELLCHRAGIYSQRNRMTKKQSEWIRDFRLTLTRSVAGIAKEPLSAEPGTAYAYSGAGYCVLGRVAEVAARAPFDRLLAAHVARPLGLLRTTYFPTVDDANIAAGHMWQNGSLAVDRLTPHLLGEQHSLALIGGSLYAPAREVAEFARMLLHRGQSRTGEVLSRSEWKEMTTVHARRPGGGYGFGLFVTNDSRTGQVQTVSHGGALFGSYCCVIVNYQTERFGVVTYTGRRNHAIRDALQAWVNAGPENQPAPVESNPLRRNSGTSDSQSVSPRR